MCVLCSTVEDGPFESACFEANFDQQRVIVIPVPQRVQYFITQFICEGAS